MATAVGQAWNLANRGDGRGDMLPAPPPQVSWDTIPDIRFDRAVAGNADISQYLNDPLGEVTSTALASGTLPTGVIYSDANRRFEYDGTDTGSDIIAPGVSIIANTSAGRIINGVDAIASWNARSQAAGVTTAENFSSYVDSADLIANAAFLGNGTTRSILTTDPTYTTSGKAFLIERLPTDGTTAAAWSMWLNSAGQTGYGRIYIQFVCYCSFDDINYIQAVANNFNFTPKFCIVDWFNGSAPNFSTEIVIDQVYKLGFITGYRASEVGGQFNYLWQQKALPFSPFTDLHYLPAIDTGTPANPTNIADWNRRFGLTDSPLTRPSGSSPGTQDDWGLPYAPALDAGGDWKKDDYNVVEIFADYPNQHLQVWHSRYGEAPVLTHSELGTADYTTRPPAEYWDHISLNDYMTEGLAEPGRPIMRRSYPEVIASTSPIDFPGGFAPPNNQG